MVGAENPSDKEHKSYPFQCLRETSNRKLEMLSNSLLLFPKSLTLSLTTTAPPYIFNTSFSGNGKAACAARLQANAGQQRHYVLIHGACHGAWCWYKVSSLLKSAGHNVSALDLAASGINPKQVNQLHSFSDYFEPLFEFMASLSSDERVVLVGHSMGGIGISLAMEMFPHKISAAVFAAATMPGPEFSYTTIAAKYAERSKSSNSLDTNYIFGNGPNNPPTALILGPNYMASNLYHCSPPEDLELARMLVRPFPVFSNPAVKNEILVTRERHGLVHRIFIICDEENAEEQRWMIQNNPPHEVKVISGSDHMLMLSKPQDLCSCLLDIGQNYS